MASEPVPLTQAEQRFFDNSANPIVQKQRFVLGNLSGSILTVTTASWHAHHPPELCFVGNGLKVERMERKHLTPEVQARWLSLQEGKLSAAYWFQSPKQTTDDFLSRIWSYLIYKNKTWVLVSILFDNSYTPESTEIQAFTATVHKAIARSINGG
jgi:exosortase O